MPIEFDWFSQSISRFLLLSFSFILIILLGTNEKALAENRGQSDHSKSYLTTFAADTLITIEGIILEAYNDPDSNVVIPYSGARCVTKE